MLPYQFDFYIFLDPSNLWLREAACLPWRLNRCRFFPLEVLQSANASVIFSLSTTW